MLASAQERDVPVISARQLLTWTDGRNGSSFGNLSWDGTGLGFTIGVGAGATNLTAMLPTTGPGGTTLTSVTRGSTAVAVTTMTVKGQQYAVFPAVGGTYRASYGAGGEAAVSGVSAQDVTADAATVTWRTDQPGHDRPRARHEPRLLTTEVDGGRAHRGAPGRARPACGPRRATTTGSAPAVPTARGGCGPRPASLPRPSPRRPVTCAPR